MKRTKKFAICAVSLACFGICSFSFTALANTSNTASTSSVASSEAVSSVTSQVEPSSEVAVSSEEVISSSAVAETSSKTEAVSSTETVSSKSSKVTETVSSQKSNSSVSGKTSSKSSTTSKSNIGGIINDEVDNSGWGTNTEESSSQTASVGMAADAATGKKMFNLAKIIWYTIWIPIALIVASAVALVHVNKKSFLEDSADSTAKKSTSKGEETGHTYRSNRPKSAPRKKVPKKNVYRPHD